MGSGVTSGPTPTYADLPRPGVVRLPGGGTTRIVERVRQVDPVRYLKRARRDDVIRSRRESFREQYTPGPTEFLNSEQFFQSTGNDAMSNVTNRDVINESATLKARLAFLTWLKDTHPKLYADAVEAPAGIAPAGVSGIFDTISDAVGKIDFGKISDGIAKAGTAYLAVKSQKDLLKLNLARANSGLPPLDTTDYGIAPTVRTEIDIDPRLASGLRDSMTMPLLIGGAALLLVLLLRKR